MRRALLITAVSLAATGSAGQAGTAVTPPLIGANYTHYQNVNCSLDDTGIVTHYDWPGIRRRVRAQLAAMRAAGIQTLRLLLWHMSDATGQRWGIVSSAGGRLAEPYRSNLIRYLSDVRRARFERLTLAFGPTWTNSPLGGNYDAAMFDEDWRFVRDVRPLLKRYGPASTRVDLLSEGAPPGWERPTVLAQEEDYITRMWSNYVDVFGGEDASFSSVGADGPYDTVARIQNLIDALRASGRLLPRWFDIHPSYDYGGTLSVLQAVDARLSADGLSQPLVVGEEAYDDEPVARAIKQFIATSTRPVLEVMEWPLRADKPCKDMSVSPPYRADAYLATLTATPMPTRLTVIVHPSGGIVFRTSYDDPVTALEAGRYTIAVSDASRVDNLHLLGPSVNERTGLRFKGTARWTVELRRGTYRYRSDRPHSKPWGSFIVLRVD
jgi:hypothetical protein